jgi:hypothetical protein
MGAEKKIMSVYHFFPSRHPLVQKFTDHYLGQASITSHDILIEKIGANTGFKLSFTIPSIEA